MKKVLTDEEIDDRWDRSTKSQFSPLSKAQVVLYFARQLEALIIERVAREAFDAGWKNCSKPIKSSTKLFTADDYIKELKDEK